MVVVGDGGFIRCQGAILIWAGAGPPPLEPFGILFGLSVSARTVPLL